MSIFTIRRHFHSVTFLLALLPGIAHSQIEIEITEVPYQEVYAFLGVYFEVGGAQPLEYNEAVHAVPTTRFGLRMHSARNSDIQMEWMVGASRSDLSSLDIPALDNLVYGEALIGGRYFPRYPTFGLGRNTPVRLTGSAAGGMLMAMSSGVSLIELDIVLTAGMAITGLEDPSGITLEFVYRPNTVGIDYSYYNEATYSDQNYALMLQPAWALRIGFLFAPG